MGQRALKEAKRIQNTLKETVAENVPSLIKHSCAVQRKLKDEQAEKQGVSKAKGSQTHPLLGDTILCTEKPKTLTTKGVILELKHSAVIGCKVSVQNPEALCLHPYQIT